MSASSLMDPTSSADQIRGGSLLNIEHVGQCCDNDLIAVAIGNYFANNVYSLAVDLARSSLRTSRYCLDVKMSPLKSASLRPITTPENRLKS